MWTCLVWAELSTPDSFVVPSHRFISATCEQKGITQTIYTNPEPPSRMPNPLMPSAKLRRANLPFLSLWCDVVGIEARPPAPRADALTTMLHGGGGGSHPDRKKNLIRLLNRRSFKLAEKSYFEHYFQ